MDIDSTPLSEPLVRDLGSSSSFVASSSPLTTALRKTHKRSRSSQSLSGGTEDRATIVSLGGCLKSPKLKHSPKHRFHPHFVRIDVTDPDQLLSVPSARPLLSISSSPLSPLPRIVTRSILKITTHPIPVAKSLLEGTRYNSEDKKHSNTLIDLREPMSANVIKSALGQQPSFSAVTSSSLQVLKASLMDDQQDLANDQVELDERAVEAAYTTLYGKLRAFACSDYGQLTAEQTYEIKNAMVLISACLKRDLEQAIDDADSVSTPISFSSSSPIPSTSTSVPKMGSLIHHPLNKSSSSPMAPTIALSPYSDSFRRSSPGITVNGQLKVPSSSSPLSLSGSKETSLKFGKSEVEIRRVRIHLDRAQSALKLLALLFHYPLYNSELSESSSQLMDLVLKILNTRRFREPKDKDIVAFALYVTSQQRLPAEQAEGFLLPTLDIVADILWKSRANAKLRRSHVEALLVVANLSATYPALFTPHCVNHSRLLPCIHETLLVDGFALRARSVAALGSMTFGLWRNWPDHSELGLVKRNQLHEALSKHTRAFFKADQPKSKLQNHEEFHKLSSLCARITQNRTSVKQDEMMWMVTVMAVLPVLFGSHMRRWEPAGLKLCAARLTDCLNSNDNAVSRMAMMAWFHYIFADALLTNKTVLANNTSERGSWWYPTSDTLKKMGQTYRMQKSKKERWSVENTKVLSGLLYIVSNQILSSADSTRSTNEAVISEDVVHARFSQTWRLFVYNETADVESFGDIQRTLSAYAADQAFLTAAIAMFSCIIRLEPANSPFEPQTILVEPLLTGRFVSASSDEVAISMSLEALSKDQQIPAWPSTWIISNIDQIFAFFDLCLDHTIKIQETFSLSTCAAESHADQYQCPADLRQAWRLLFQHVSECTDIEPISKLDKILITLQVHVSGLHGEADHVRLLKRSWYLTLIDDVLDYFETSDGILTPFIEALSELSPSTDLVRRIAAIQNDTIIHHWPLVSISNALQVYQLRCARDEQFQQISRQIALLWGRFWDQESLSVANNASESGEVERSFAQFMATNYERNLHSTNDLLSMANAFAVAPLTSVQTVVAILSTAFQSAIDIQHLLTHIIRSRASHNLLLPEIVYVLCAQSLSLSPQPLIQEIKYSLSKLTNAAALEHWLEGFKPFIISYLSASKPHSESIDLYIAALSALAKLLKSSECSITTLAHWRDVIVSIWTMQEDLPPQSLIQALAELWQSSFGSRHIKPEKEDLVLRRILHITREAYPSLVAPVDELDSLENAIDAQSTCESRSQNLEAALLVSPAVNSTSAQMEENSYQTDLSTQIVTDQDTQVMREDWKRPMKRKRQVLQTVTAPQKNAQIGRRSSISEVVVPGKASATILHPAVDEQDVAAASSPKKRRKHNPLPSICVEIPYMDVRRNIFSRKDTRTGHRKMPSIRRWASEGDMDLYSEASEDTTMIVDVQHPVCKSPTKVKISMDSNELQKLPKGFFAAFQTAVKRQWMQLLGNADQAVDVA